MLFTTAILSLLFSAFFSGVEIAFISANKLQLELEKSKSKFSSKMQAFFCKNESDFITTMLVGNNISLVIYGITMTKILTPKLEIFVYSDSLLLLLQTLIATIIVLVTAEFLPKAIFRTFPNHIINIFTIPIWLLFIFLRPAAILMFKISNLLLKYVLNQKIHKDSHVFGKNDLDDLLSNVKSVDGHQEHRIEVEMLQNALDLSEKRVRECMVPRTEIVAIDFNTSLESVKSKFISTKLSKLLVFKNNINILISYILSRFNSNIDFVSILASQRFTLTSSPPFCPSFTTTLTFLPSLNGYSNSIPGTAPSGKVTFIIC